MNDLLGVIGDWNCNGGSCLGDVDGDGTVGVNDLLLVLSKWGVC